MTLGFECGPPGGRMVLLFVKMGKTGWREGIGISNSDLRS